MATESQGSNGHGVAGFAANFNAENAQEMLDQSKVVMEEAVEKAGNFIRERPILCLAGALAVGYLIGKIVSR